MPDLQWMARGERPSVPCDCYELGGIGTAFPQLIAVGFDGDGLGVLMVRDTNGGCHPLSSDRFDKAWFTTPITPPAMEEEDDG